MNPDWIEFREREKNRDKAFGRLMYSLKKKFDHWASEELECHFQGKVKTGHMPFLMNIGSAGTTNTELAKKLMVTKQAMSKTLKELLEMGMIEQQPNPKDARSSMLFLTPYGVEVILTCRRNVDRYTANISEKMGAERYQLLLDLMFELDTLMEFSEKS